MNSSSNLLVLGVTGQVGKLVAKHLKRSKAHFSVGSRRKENLKELADQFGASRFIDLELSWHFSIAYSYRVKERSGDLLGLRRHFALNHSNSLPKVMSGSPDGISSTECNPRGSGTSRYPNILPVSESSLTTHPAEPGGWLNGCIPRHNTPPTSLSE
jgi:hypothetical protein